MAAVVALGAALLLVSGAGSALGRESAAADGGPSDGGAPVVSGELAPISTGQRIPAPPSKHDRGRWLGGLTISEYWPSPESSFVGKLVDAPGLVGMHRIDWLYSATGISMQGEGIGLDGRLYHLQAPGDGGWVTASGRPTSPSDGWLNGAPFWRAGGYWRNSRRAVTFPLAAGGWSADQGRRYVPLAGVSFAPGGAPGLRYYQSIAVDPAVIPLGSHVYVPAYQNDGHGGWFVAQDRGGAINGLHIDVFRPPPATAADPGQFFYGQRIYVIKPAH
jgi:3D (Asp-Asp-Asp) domain-containing protein